MKNLRRTMFQMETNKGTKGLCEMLCNQLSNEDFDFGDNFQITVTKKDIFTDVTIDYIEDNEECDEDEYTPECIYGYDDCISDPAYVRYYHDKDKKGCDGCESGNWYDNEDK